MVAARELAEFLGISVLPVKRAFERLRTEGLLITTSGKRPVVGGGNELWNVQDLWSFSEEMKSRGMTATTKRLSFAADSGRYRGRGCASTESRG